MIWFARFGFHGWNSATGNRVHGRDSRFLSANSSPRDQLFAHTYDLEPNSFYGVRFGSPGKIRTSNISVNSRTLYHRATGDHFHFVLVAEHFQAKALGDMGDMTRNNRGE